MVVSAERDYYLPLRNKAESVENNHGKIAMTLSWIGKILW